MEYIIFLNLSIPDAPCLTLFTVLYLQANIWDANTGQLRSKLNTNSPVIDICSFRSSGDNSFMTTLTEKQLNIYKWR